MPYIESKLNRPINCHFYVFGKLSKRSNGYVCSFLDDEITRSIPYGPFECYISGTATKIQCSQIGYESIVACNIATYGERWYEDYELNKRIYSNNEFLHQTSNLAELEINGVDNLPFPVFLSKDVNLSMHSIDVVVDLGISRLSELPDLIGYFGHFSGNLSSDSAKEIAARDVERAGQIRTFDERLLPVSQVGTHKMPAVLLIDSPMRNSKFTAKLVTSNFLSSVELIGSIISRTVHWTENGVDKFATKELATIVSIS